MQSRIFAGATITFEIFKADAPLYLATGTGYTTGCRKPRDTVEGSTFVHNIFELKVILAISDRV